MARFEIFSGITSVAAPSPPLVPSSSQRVQSLVPGAERDLMTLIVPIAAVEAQVVAVTLNDQPYRIDLYQKSTGLFADVYIADQPIALGVLARDRSALAAGLAFYDTQGSSDPQYDGLGTRWQLVHLS